ncbi:MAG: hypothetical protein A3F26_02630 [Candidatus Ryanbacteria bacterium RIFCSPHIGHO2_12_FULL_47_12b]|uniref:DUF458 domain-containing protein n=2 Tax=Candidatus Ryaniibacteriota TaxID=1817914 RepID=A0A1G2H6Y0_9BACT|nr:MAG: hypothetical protein A3C83_03270 [Candidatus Ryanbacteria bacterium RIFCSPHIGHO2_02_FULL_47_25]OGZ52152.1 MAG: hypothetical protein A3F26_02630 [Candidatus Ryanbacteria bacterium RIFCSPHIGHO2_12_FULL_47_12b]OGZ56308.1 MAG: hypothetical protein A3J04_04270 [Candidatus Ryanbacteria bacterium RIFCSPLOWO2_02_FULL_47_14]OGZ57698.1 MAG: hypothetical protein A3G60_00795 [Candidatus Ryanbacteria bacterium RIFCSPLOWO2_12_FULL_47_9c]
MFHSTTHGNLSLTEVISEIHRYTQHHKNSRYEISIGTDSQAYGKTHANFVTAIVVRRIGNGAIYFWTRRSQRFYNLQHRIQLETMLSITLAQECRSTIREKLGDEILWDGVIEIHLDIGGAGQTRDFLDVMTGMVRAYQMVPVIKPDSYGAFAVADKHT